MTSLIEDEGKITVVEGDFTDGNYDLVAENEYLLSDDKITGFGVIPKDEAKAAEIFTAEDSGVKVQVTAPDTALPKGAELYILLYDENRSEYRAAGEAIGLDDEGTSMAALDIAFSLNGEKVEPSEEVAVRIDISGFLPKGADPRTVAVSHLEEKNGEIEPALVADLSDDTEGTIDTETPAAEFTVGSFSTFAITWRDYDAESDLVSINVASYLYDGDTTTTELDGRDYDMITNIDTSQAHNEVDLTSSNQDIATITTSTSTTSGGGWGGGQQQTTTTTTNTYTVVTATVNLVINGSTISIEDAQSISVSDYDSSAGTYTVTVATSSGTVTYTGVTSTSINLYYELTDTTTTTSSGGGQGGQTTNSELDASSYNSSSYVYWDVFETDDSGNSTGVGSGNASAYIQSVTMGAADQYSVTNEDSTKTSTNRYTTSGVYRLYDYFPNADAGSTGGGWGQSASDPVTESGTLIITPVTGCYVTQVVIACCATNSSYGLPYGCQTWDAGNAYDVKFNISASGVMEIDVSSLHFSHSSSSGYYFILIKVSPVADPLYVQYDYGDISFLNIDESTYTGAFSSASGWTDASDSNSYGSTNTQIIADGEVGVKTEDTQFKYGYNDVSETAGWVHYSNTITDAAKEEAAAAGYYFAGWYTEYYYYAVPYFYSSTNNTSPYSTTKSYIYMKKTMSMILIRFTILQPMAKTNL